MAKTLIVSADLGEFEKGAELTRGPVIAAYLMEMLNTMNDRETTLSAAEVQRTFKATDIEGLSPEDAEIKLIEALTALEGGVDEEEEAAPISVEASIARQHSAHTLASKLNGQFNAHMIAILDAGELVKRGPVTVADDAKAKWTIEEILSMPMPGSKAGTTAEDKAKQVNMVFDYYKVTASDGTTIRGSWYGDIILATPEGERLSAILKGKQAEYDKAKDLGLADQIKLEKDRLNKATGLLRKGVSFLIVLHKLAACPLLEIEVQREADGTASRTLFPVVIWQKGQSGSRKSLTLSQVLGLLKPDVDGMDGIDRTIAKGGTLKAFVDYGLAKKAPKKGKAIAISNTDNAYDVLFAFNTYLQNGGDGAIAKQVNGPKSEAWVSLVGDLMSYIAPVYNSGDVAARYRAYNASDHASDAAKAAAKATADKAKTFKAA